MRTLSTSLRLLLPLGALALAGCTLEPEACEPGDCFPLDADDDGYPASVDCDESDPDIHPGAFELCDEIDNDCDGDVDEIYGDSDNDGFVDCLDSEECDGVDNDGDGIADEGWPDWDADGVADCVDDDCVLYAAEAGTVDLVGGCGSMEHEIVDPWRMRTEWHWEGGEIFGLAPDVLSAPVVAELDGQLPPEIIVLASGFNPYGYDDYTVAMVLDAQGQMRHFFKPRTKFFATSTSIGVADIDSDGSNEVVGFANNRCGYRVVAFDSEGEQLWWSNYCFDFYGYYPKQNGYGMHEAMPLQVTFGDLDGDGAAEVVAHNLVLDGTTGRVLSVLDYDTEWTFPVVADLDADGSTELVFGNGIYDGVAVEAGEDDPEIWLDASGYTIWPMVVDADGDSTADVVLVQDSGVAIFNADGSAGPELTDEYATRSPACAGDFDGDGKVELAWTEYSEYWEDSGLVDTGGAEKKGWVLHNKLVVYDDAGGMLWSADINDPWGTATCSGFDFDDDGDDEVIYADQAQLTVYDGATGTELMSDDEHSSLGLLEHPVVADIDADGAAEIVVVNNQPMTMRPMGKERVVKGVTVYGHSGEGWASTGFDWPQYDYRVTNLGADGSVPAVPPTPWLDDNMVRTRPVAYYPEANLQVEIIDVCAAGCEEHSPVEVSVQVSNTGTMEIPAGLSVALYAEDGVHNWTLLGVQVTTAALPAGESSDALLYDITLPDLGEWGLVARVDDDGMGVTAIDECLEDDNVDRWRGAICDYTGYEGARKRRPDHGWRIVPIFGDDGRFEIGLEE